MNRAQHQMMKIVQKIPVFDGLSLEQAQRLIQISRFKQYVSGDTIYDVGEQGDEMLVLVKGKLSVLSATGQPLGEVMPGNSTGEMGVFTGHKRSATIVAMDDCAALAVTRNMLYDIMNQDHHMKSIILENVVNELSRRLAESNTRLDVLSRQVAEQTPAEPAVAEEAEQSEADAAEAVIAEAAEETAEGDDDDQMPEGEEMV